MQKLYGKNFNFPKQHAPSHLGYDIANKGATRNYCTHVGEGFQQESRQAYLQTNFKKAEQQVSLHNFLLVFSFWKDNIPYMLSLDDTY